MCVWYKTSRENTIQQNTNCKQFTNSSKKEKVFLILLKIESYVNSLKSPLFTISLCIYWLSILKNANTVWVILA